MKNVKKNIILFREVSRKIFVDPVFLFMCVCVCVCRVGGEGVCGGIRGLA